MPSSRCPCRACTRASGQRIPDVPYGALYRPRNLFTPRAQARSELVWPLVRGLENHTTPLPTDQYLVRGREATSFGKPDRLTPSVLKQLRASASHTESLDASLYRVNGCIDHSCIRVRRTSHRWMASITGQPPGAHLLALGNHPPLAGIIAAIQFGGKSFYQCESPDFIGARAGNWCWRQLPGNPCIGGRRHSQDWRQRGWHTVNLG